MESPRGPLRRRDGVLRFAKVDALEGRPMGSTFEAPHPDPVPSLRLRISELAVRAGRRSARSSRRPPARSCSGSSWCRDRPQGPTPTPMGAVIAALAFPALGDL